MSLLVVLIPQSVVAVVVLEVEDAAAVLFVLHPVALIAFAVGERVDTVSLALALHKFALVGVAVVEGDAAFAMGSASHYLTLVLPHAFALLDGERTYGDTLCQGCETEGEKKGGYE